MMQDLQQNWNSSMQLFLIDDHKINDLKVDLNEMADGSYFLIDLQPSHQFLAQLSP